MTQDGRRIIQCMPDYTHNSSTCGTELLYRTLNRAALNGQFPLSAETTPSRGETPAAGKVHSHDVTTFTVRLAPNEEGENHRVLKRCRHRNASKRGSSRGNTRRKEIQLLGSMKNAAFVRRQTKCGRTRSSLFVIFNIFPFTMWPTFSWFLWFSH